MDQNKTLSIDFIREYFHSTPTVPAGPYSMWWSDGDASFSASPVRQQIRRAYETLDQIHSYVFADLINAIEGGQRQARVGMPDDIRNFLLVDSRGHPLVISVSSAKGIRLHLPETTSTVEYRLQIWRGFADYATHWLDEVNRNGQPGDAPAPPKPLDWWTQTERFVLSLEARKDPANRIGTMQL